MWIDRSIECVLAVAVSLWLCGCSPAGHPNMGGPMRMNPPRGMAMGPQVRQSRKREAYTQCTYDNVDVKSYIKHFDIFLRCIFRFTFSSSPHRNQLRLSQLLSAVLSLLAYLQYTCVIYLWEEQEHEHFWESIMFSPPFYLTSCPTELWRYEASTQLHGRPHARNEHVS